MRFEEMLGETFGPALEDTIDFQKFCDIYGVQVEGEPYEEQGKGILDTKYVIKFSVPETWEEGLVIKTPEEIKQEFKKRFFCVMVAFWNAAGEDFDVDDPDEMKSLESFFKFMCRVRKGECWTLESQKEAAATTKQQMELAMEQLKKQEEFEEV